MSFGETSYVVQAVENQLPHCEITVKNNYTYTDNDKGKKGNNDF